MFLELLFSCKVNWATDNLWDMKQCVHEYTKHSIKMVYTVRMPVLLRKLRMDGVELVLYFLMILRRMKIQTFKINLHKALTAGYFRFYPFTH